jgi:nicotinate-nucleotide adenylyltransferase
MKTSAMKTGLYFGSFNPIHMGHLVIANHMATHLDLEEVWLVVTPQSPHKDPLDLIAPRHRLQMARLAVADNPLLRVSDVEFQLPAPNFTAHTMAHLRAVAPERVFSIIIGEDNYHSLHRWKDFGALLEQHRILVARRESEFRTQAWNASGGVAGEGQIPEIANHPHVVFCDTPMISVSSTYLRQAIRNHQDIRYLLPDAVLNYIENNRLYEAQEPESGVVEGVHGGPQSSPDKGFD